MRKSPIIILLLVIVVAIFSAPFFFGMLAEKQIRQFVQTIDPNSDVKVTLLSYNRGWFKSDVTFSMQVNSSQIHRLVNQLTTHPLDPQIQSIVLTGTTTIFHGPIILNKQISQDSFLTFGKAALIYNAAISSASQKLLMNTFTGTFPTISGIARVGFGNKVKITLNTTPLNIQQKNTDNAAHFSTLKGNWKINLNDKFIDGIYELTGFGVTGNNMTLNIESITASYQGEGEIFNITPHLGIMNETVKVPHAVVQQNQKTIFELTNGKLFNQSVLNDSKYDVTQIIEVDKATLNDKTYGPGRYIVVFKHIDPATANQFIRQLAALKKAATEKERNYLALSSVSNFAQFFTKGAELELSFDLLTPEGPVAARSLAAFNKDLNAAANATQLANAMNAQSPIDFLKKLKLNFELKLPIALTEKIFTTINDQYLEHQKSTPASAVNQSQQANPNVESLQASLAGKSDQEIEQMAEQNTKQQLQQLLNSGSLIESNGSYQMAIELKDGEIFVNGKNVHSAQPVEPGVTAPAVEATQPTTPIMLLAPNAVKSEQTTTTTTTTPIAPDAANAPHADSANQVIQQTTTKEITETKKVPVSQ